MGRDSEETAIVEAKGLKQIKTSESGWLARLSKAYRTKASIVFIDDAGTGADPRSMNLREMGGKARLSLNQWAGALVGAGMAGWGATMVAAAVVDPEPTSKLGLLVGSGAVMVLGGGFAAMRVLTGVTPPKIRVLPGGGFEIRWS